MKVHTHFAFNFMTFYILGLTPFRPLIFFVILLGSILPDVDDTDTQMIRFAKFWLIDKFLFLLFAPFLLPLFLADWLATKFLSTSLGGIIDGFKRATDIFWTKIKRSPIDILRSLWAFRSTRNLTAVESEETKLGKKNELSPEEKTQLRAWKIPFVVLRTLIFNLQPWESRADRYGRKEAFEEYAAKALPFNFSYTKVSDYINDRWGHRTITHSFLFLALIALLILPFIFIFPVLQLPFIVFMLTLFLHFVLDTMNISGVYFLYPANVICVFPAAQTQRSRSGDFTDYSIFAISLIMIIFLVLLSFQGGLFRCLHLAIKDPWCAVVDHYRFAPTHRVVVQVTEGREVQTDRPISGNLLAAGSPNNVSLILEDKDHYKYLIGQPPWATLTGKTVAFKDIPITSTTEEIRLENKPMSEFITQIENKGGDECRITGFMNLSCTSEHLPLANYPTIMRSGPFYEFTLADIYDIKRFGLANSFIISANVKLKIVHYQAPEISSFLFRR